MTEAEMLAPVLEWFASDGWFADTEVPVRIPSYGSPASLHTWTPDAILRKGDEVAVLEGKLALTDTLVAQADRWRPYAHFVWCAVGGLTVASTTHESAMMAERGIGIIRSTGEDVSVVVFPRKNEKVDLRPILDALPDTQGNYVPAGSPGGLRMTTDQWRWQPVRRVLAEFNARQTARAIWDGLPLDDQMGWGSYKAWRLAFQKAAKNGIIGVVVHETPVLTYSLTDAQREHMG